MKNLIIILDSGFELFNLPQTNFGRVELLNIQKLQQGANGIIKKTRNFAVGDVSNSSTPRCHWSLGNVINSFLIVMEQ